MILTTVRTAWPEHGTSPRPSWAAVASRRRRWTSPGRSGASTRSWTPGQSSVWCPGNDLTIGWQKLNPLSHPNATLAPQARQEGPVVKIWTTCKVSILTSYIWSLCPGHVVSLVRSVLRGTGLWWRMSGLETVWSWVSSMSRTRRGWLAPQHSPWAASPWVKYKILLKYFQSEVFWSPRDHWFVSANCCNKKRDHKCKNIHYLVVSKF